MKRFFRWGLAILCLAGAYRLFTVGITLGITPGAFVCLVAMFLCVIVAAALFLPESLPIVTRPFTAMIDGVYGTGPGKGRPPYDCTLARGYVKQRRIEEALREYARVMKFHPREAEPYREIVRLMLREFDNQDGANRIFHRGLRKLRSKEEKEALRAIFQEEVAFLEERRAEMETGG